MKTIKGYDLNKSLVFTIQQITQDKTHEILQYFESKVEELLIKNEIDISKPLKVIDDVHVGENLKITYHTHDYFNISDTIQYKKSSIFFNLSIIGEYERECDSYIMQYNLNRNSSSNTKSNIIHISIKERTSLLKLTDRQFNDIIADGIIADASIDFDFPPIKKRKTLKEKQQQQLKNIINNRIKSVTRTISVLNKNIEAKRASITKIEKRITQIDKQLNDLSKNKAPHFKELKNQLVREKKNHDLVIADLQKSINKIKTTEIPIEEKKLATLTDSNFLSKGDQ